MPRVHNKREYQTFQRSSLNVYGKSHAWNANYCVLLKLARVVALRLSNYCNQSAFGSEAFPKHLLYYEWCLQCGKRRLSGG